MAVFGTKSTNNLNTCERDLQTVLREAIKFVDFSVIYGHRTPQVQFELYKKGRKEKGGKWVIDDLRKVVTYRDGIEKKSDHNFYPAKAADIIPYPFPGWRDPEYHEQAHYIAGIIFMISKQFLKEGKITHEVHWGGKWKNLVDEPHYYLKRVKK